MGLYVIFLKQNSQKKYILVFGKRGKMMGNLFRKYFRSIRTYAALLSVAILVSTANIALEAESILVPAGIQAGYLSKIIKYNTKLSSKSHLKMLIVYNSKTEFQKEALSSVMQNKMQIKTAYPNEADKLAKECDIVYFMPNCEQSARVCKSHKTLSISSQTKPVMNGEVSIAIGLENEKPRIFVNVSSLKAEEQTFSNDLLSIARVFR
jgi:hypothetical protein